MDTVDTVTTQYIEYAGIDVSKSQLDCALLRQNQPFLSAQFANDADSHAALLTWVKQHAKDSLIVVEATGGYEAAMVAKLATNGLRVAVVNPRQVRDFSKATGVLAKTDAIDACVLAQFGRAIQPQVRTPKAGELAELEAVLTRRRQLIEMITTETHRRSAMTSRVIAKQIDQHLKYQSKSA